MGPLNQSLSLSLSASFPRLIDDIHSIKKIVLKTKMNEIFRRCIQHLSIIDHLKSPPWWQSIVQFFRLVYSTLLHHRSWKMWESFLIDPPPKWISRRPLMITFGGRRRLYFTSVSAVIDGIWRIAGRYPAKNPSKMTKIRKNPEISSKIPKNPEIYWNFIKNPSKFLKNPENWSKIPQNSWKNLKFHQKLLWNLEKSLKILKFHRLSWKIPEKFWNLIKITLESGKIPKNLN